MSGGKIAEKGRYDELLQNGGAFAKLVEEYGSAESEKKGDDEGESKEGKDGNEKDIGEQKKKKEEGKLIEAEERETGTSKLFTSPLTSFYEIDILHSLR